MKGLILSELRRLHRRRMVRLSIPAATIVIGIITVAAALLFDTQRTTPPEFVDGMVYQSSLRNSVQRVRILDPIAWLLPLFGFAIGASYIGADTRQGVLEHLLTWEPRRVRHMITRSLSTAAIVGALAVGISSLVVLAGFVLTVRWGSVGKIHVEVIWALLLAVIRSGIVTALFGLIGLNLTTIMRSSAGAIVLMSLYSLQLESILANVLWRFEEWMPLVNARAFMAGTGVSTTRFGEEQGIYDHELPMVALILVSYCIVTFVIASILFTRRDM